MLFRSGESPDSELCQVSVRARADESGNTEEHTCFKLLPTGAYVNNRLTSTIVVVFERYISFRNISLYSKAYALHLHNVHKSGYYFLI